MTVDEKIARLVPELRRLVECNCRGIYKLNGTLKGYCMDVPKELMDKLRELLKA